MFGFLKALQAAGSKSLVGKARLQNVFFSNQWT